MLDSKRSRRAFCGWCLFESCIFLAGCISHPMPKRKVIWHLNCLNNHINRSMKKIRIRRSSRPSSGRISTGINLKTSRHNVHLQASTRKRKRGSTSKRRSGNHRKNHGNGNAGPRKTALKLIDQTSEILKTIIQGVGEGAEMIKKTVG